MPVRTSSTTVGSCQHPGFGAPGSLPPSPRLLKPSSYLFGIVGFGGVVAHVIVDDDDEDDDVVTVVVAAVWCLVAVGGGVFGFFWCFSCF